MWEALKDFFGLILATIYGVWPSYGVAIIVLTLIVRIALLPLTAKQVRSMRAMQQYQPEIKRIQEQYRDDPQKRNEEIMRFYKENQISPAAGCLPLIAQMPVLFAMYAVLRKPVKHIPAKSDLFGAFCGSLTPDKCTKPKGLSFLGMNLSKAASDGFNSFGKALPYFILIALMIVSGLLQARQMQARQTGPANPQMVMVSYVMPVVFGLFSFQFPSGLVLYWFVGNLWTMFQQLVIFRKDDSKTAPAKFVRSEVVEVEPDESSSRGSAKPAPPPSAPEPAKPIRPARDESGGRAKPTKPTKPTRPTKATGNLPTKPSGKPTGGQPGPRDKKRPR